MRVLVAEPSDEAESDLTIRLMIKEATAIGMAVDVQRPTLRVNHPARLMLVGRNVPQFLDTNPINLRVAVGFEIISCFDLLGQVTARAFSEERVTGVEFKARLVIRPLFTFTRDAHVTSGDALYRALLILSLIHI